MREGQQPLQAATPAEPASSGRERLDGHFQLSPEETTGSLFHELGNGQRDLPTLLPG
ncbi:MAG: hypothetical protein ACOC3J_03205 [Gemmatimonadota bacterium]